MIIVWKLVALMVVPIGLILSISRWKMHPFIALILGALSCGLMTGPGANEMSMFC